MSAKTTFRPSIRRRCTGRASTTLVHCQYNAVCVVVHCQCENGVPRSFVWILDRSFVRSFVWIFVRSFGSFGPSIVHRSIHPSVHPCIRWQFRELANRLIVRLAGGAEKSMSIGGGTVNESVAGSVEWSVGASLRRLGEEQQKPGQH